MSPRKNYSTHFFCNLERRHQPYHPFPCPGSLSPKPPGKQLICVGFVRAYTLMQQGHRKHNRLAPNTPSAKPYSMPRVWLRDGSRPFFVPRPICRGGPKTKEGGIYWVVFSAANVLSHDENVTLLYKSM